MADKDNDFGVESEVEKTSIINFDLPLEEDNFELTTEIKVNGTNDLPKSAALLVVKRGPNAGSRFLLDKAVTSVGRHPDSDIFLDDVTVSRRHAQFLNDNVGNIVIKDLGSLNGIYVNREPVAEFSLNNGDEIQIGKYRLIIIKPEQ